MERPKLKLQTPLIGRLFDGIALLVLAVSAINIFMHWSSLPAQVPSHYNALGEPDAWSSRGFVFVPLLIGSILWVGLHVLEKFPHIHNYSGLTKINAEPLYKNSMLMLNFIKNEFMLIFTIGSWNDIHVANGNDSFLGVWELPLTLLIIFGTLLFFIWRSIQLKKSNEHTPF